MERVKTDRPEHLNEFEPWWRAVEETAIKTATERLRAYGVYTLTPADIVQDVALRAYFVWNKLRTHPGAGEDISRESDLNFFPNRDRSIGWIRTRTQWVCLDKLKAQRNWIPLENADAEISTDASPASELALKEIQALINALPSEQREVLQLWGQGYTGREIAFKLEKKEDSVRSLLRHARHSMLKLMAERETS
jgi:hypothetical protein